MHDSCMEEDGSAEEALPSPCTWQFLRQQLLASGGYVSAAAIHSVFAIMQRKLPEEAGPGGLDKASASASFAFFWVGWALAGALVLPAVEGAGRKKPYLVLLALGIAATLACSQACSATLFAASVFCLGLFLPPSGLVGYLLMQESAPDGSYATSTAISNVAYSSYGMLIAGVGGLLLREASWRVEVLLWHCPLALVLCLSLRFLQESPGFASKAAAVGGAALWRDPELRWRLLLTLPCWTAAVVGFFGLNSSAGSLSSSFYTNLALLSATDIVAYAFTGFVTGKLGARTAQVAAFAAAAGCLLSCAGLPFGWARVVAAVAGRLALDVAFTTIYILLLESFPMGLRATAAGSMNAVARLAGLCTPLFGLLPLPACCTATAALCAAAAAATWALPTDGEGAKEVGEALRGVSCEV